ncbi:MAG: AsmA-like C-terminal region-containing protein [Kiritimatiellia bacterium]|jgi:hypothetical protein|nr:AsmA-like C-terminal region-containing protein [Kiritimatiellia bacterium]
MLTVLLFSVALLVIYLGSFGFPEWATQILMNQLNRGSFVIDPALVQFHPLEGVVLRDVKVYRKGAVGPAALEAEEIVGDVDIMAPFTGAQFVQELKISRGIYRPGMMKGKPRKARPVEREDVVAIELSDMDFRGVRLKKVYFKLRSFGMTMYAEDIRAVVGEESGAENMTGKASYERDQKVLDVSVETTFDPHILLPLISAWKMRSSEKLINRFDFAGMAPRCTIDFRRSFREGRRLSLDGKVWMQDCAYRGVDILRFDAQTHLEITDRASTLSVGPMLVVRPEGITSGKFTVRPEKGTVDFDVESSFSPRALASMIGVFTNEVAQKVRLEGAFTISARGVAGLKDRSLHDITGSAHGRGVGYRDILTDQYSFDLAIKGATNTLSNVKGRLFDADFDAGLELFAPSGSSTTCWYTAHFNTHNADFEQIAKILSSDPERDYEGMFSTRFNLKGPLSTNHSQLVEGDVHLKIRDGRVLLLPIFGGLSQYMAKIVPGLDFVLRQGDAKADFVVGAGKMHSDNVGIEGDVLSLKGKGDYYLNQNLDFTVQLTLMKSHPLVGKLLRVITWPISKLFEFRLQGTTTEPEWYPINFSSELLERLGLGKRNNGTDKPDETGAPVDPDEPGESGDAPDRPRRPSDLPGAILKRVGLGNLTKSNDSPAKSADTGENGEQKGDDQDAEITPGGTGSE